MTHIKIINNQIINLIIDDNNWVGLNFKLKNATKKAIEATLSYLNYFHSIKTIELTIQLSNDHFLNELNKKFLNKDYPTNILSFPSYELSKGNFASLQNEAGSIYLGDIAVSFERINEESLAQSKTFKNYYTHIIVHGILHLLGYDHQKAKEADIMENTEIQILKSLKISNPYILTK